LTTTDGFTTRTALTLRVQKYHTFTLTERYRTYLPSPASGFTGGSCRLHLKHIAYGSSLGCHPTPPYAVLLLPALDDTYLQHGAFPGIFSVLNSYYHRHIYLPGFDTITAWFSAFYWFRELGWDATGVCLLPYTSATILSLQHIIIRWNTVGIVPATFLHTVMPPSSATFLPQVPHLLLRWWLLPWIARTGFRVRRATYTTLPPLHCYDAD